MRLLSLSACAVLLTSLLLMGAAVKPTETPPGQLPQAHYTQGAAAATQARSGSLTYRARVVHNNRSAISYVHGRVDFASGDFEEDVDRSYLLDWKQLPGRMLPARALLPSIWSVGGRSAQQLGDTLPRFDSPLLRHFILGQLLARPESLVKDAQFLAGQLVVNSADFDSNSFEVLCSFRGAPLVLVGRREQKAGLLTIRELAVLGPASELYQYFFEQLDAAATPLSPAPVLPQLDRDRYVTFPGGAAQPVAIRPVKDWLVFQATLPGGRPLNLVFDSGAEQMIVDDLVLKLDSRLTPDGEVSVSGPAGDSPMQLYEGFSFDVGGVHFKGLSVAGTALTQLGYNADVRIHGVVGNEILQLCKLDLDLEHGQMLLSPPGTAGSEAVPSPDTAQLPLTFIRELPHIEGAVHNDQPALLLLDTGQRTPLSVNLDFLEHYKLGNDLKMDGFLGDITGGFMPRYIVESLPVSLAGATFNEKAVDASPDSTFNYGGVPVVGAIGFPLLAHHFGGITFDYSRKLLWLRDPAASREFIGQPGAWTVPAAQPQVVKVRGGEDEDSLADEVQAQTAQADPRAHPAGHRQLGLDPGGYEDSSPHAHNPNTPERAEQMREEARQRKAEREKKAQEDKDQAAPKQ